MKIIVEKYGGTSLGSIDHIKTVAKRVVATKAKGYGVAVVVSAMGKTTDNLINMVKEIAPLPRQREMGMLLSTGEVISCSLLAMAIQAMGLKATALTGAQAGIFTDSVYDNARITNINTSRIKELLNQDEITIMAGYQGKAGDEITVLGRGGSDASAVALAAALKAEHCHIFSDVPGVFTADPRIVSDAVLLPGISYEEMIELAGSGAQIMMGRSIEIARNYGIKVKVSSSFKNSPGTIITKEDELEKVIITGVAVNKSVVLIDLKVESNNMAKILKKINENQINIKLLSSNGNDGQLTNLSLIIKRDDIESMIKILTEFQHRNQINDYTVNRDVSQISIVGSGIATHHGVAYKMFETLSKNGIRILMTSTSEIKITAVIPIDKADLAVRKLHKEFELNGLQRNHRN